MHKFLYFVHLETVNVFLLWTRLGINAFTKLDSINHGIYCVHAVIHCHSFSCHAIAILLAVVLNNSNSMIQRVTDHGEIRILQHS